jgi:hypothetical protein
MKILPIAVLLVMMNLNTAFCPSYNTLYISSPIKVTLPSLTIYDPLIEAIFTFEAGRNTNAYNSSEQATGGLQITPILVEEYNRLTNKNYTLTDMYNFSISKEVFLYFATHDHSGHEILPKSYEQAAKDWNGSGPMTEVYWREKIRPLLKV